jgi:CRISPR-associated protein Cmr4
MFEQTRMLFLYAVTPVHMGAGQAIGVIDNPIQRERHTNHPNMAGSGLKGAIRHQAVAMDGWDKELVNRLFGPDSGNSLYAGAVSFGDAQLVAFPVRSLKQAFVYAVSPTSLARLKRLASLAGKATDWSIPEIDSDHALVCGERGLNQNRLVLEAFDFAAATDKGLQAIAAWLSTHALPDGDAHQYFREKIQADLVLLPDDAFSHFVENATVVEPHVKINDDTGTAQEGGLFYTENLPPESLLVSPVFSSVERYQNHKPDDCNNAAQVMALITCCILRIEAKETNMSNRLTLDQQRANYAWEKAEEAAQHGIIEEYTNLAKSVASLIMNSGLMQTLAFLQAKKDDQHEVLKTHLCKWLGRTLGGTKVTEIDEFPLEPAADFQHVMTALYNSKSDLYMRATSETMALLRWIRQLADARKTMEKTP